MTSQEKLRRLANLIGGDKRKARLVSFWNYGEWFFPIRDWPTWAMEIALLLHKNNQQRYKFFQFLTFNGLDPELAKEWTLIVDFQGSRSIRGNYDNAANTQLDDCVAHSQDGTLFDRLACMDMKAGKVRYIWQGHEYTGPNREAAWKRARESGG